MAQQNTVVEYPSSSSGSSKVSNLIPHFSTQGSFYEVGFNVGAHFQERIQLFFKESEEHHKSVIPLYDSREGREFFEENLQLCQTCFPQYVREVRGIADGSGIPFEQVFMTNIWERYLKTLIQKDKDTSSSAAAAATATTAGGPEFGCSTLFINNDTTRLIIHTEDQAPLVGKYSYLVTARISDDHHDDHHNNDNKDDNQHEDDNDEDGNHCHHRGHVYKEHFTAFCCPGCLPGRAFSVNHQGLVVTSNAIRPAHLQRGSPSRLFHTRAIVSSPTIQEAISRASNQPYGSAYGFTANLANKDGDMVSLEVGPGKPQAAVHIQPIPTKSSSGSGSSGGGGATDSNSSTSSPSDHYYHFNAYKHLQIPEVQTAISSAHRARRVGELPAPRTFQDALAVASDAQDAEFPIHRTPRPSDPALTVCTALCDVVGNQLRLYGDRERLMSDTPDLTLPLWGDA